MLRKIVKSKCIPNVSSAVKVAVYLRLKETKCDTKYDVVDMGDVSFQM